MTPIAWIVRHRLDKLPREHALYYREEEAYAHAGQYASGVCTVVPVVDGDEAAKRIAEIKAALSSLLAGVEQQGGRGYDMEYRVETARAALKDAP